MESIDELPVTYFNFVSVGAYNPNYDYWRETVQPTNHSDIMKQWQQKKSDRPLCFVPLPRLHVVGSLHLLTFLVTSSSLRSLLTL